MITGATQILGCIPGSNLDPFLLVQSQAKDCHGFVLIAYTGEQPVFDLLFHDGPQVWRSARLAPRFRFIVDATVVQKKFAALRSNAATLVYYFSAPEESVMRFVTTFYFEPFLKCNLAPLSRRQRLSVLEKNVHHGTLCELDQFSCMPPSVDLLELSSTEDLRAIRPLPREGLLLLYDLEMNAELVREKARYGILPGQARTPLYGAEQRDVESGRIDSAQQELFPLTNNRLDGGNRRARPGAETQNTTVAQPPARERTDDAEFISVMKDLVSTFRQEISERLGEGTDRVLDKGEQVMRKMCRGFDSTRLTTDTALFALEYIRAVAMHAPFLKRSLVKWIAASAVSEFYTKHYMLIRKYDLMEMTEQAYYRLTAGRKSRTVSSWYAL